MFSLWRVSCMATVEASWPEEPSEALYTKAHQSTSSLGAQSSLAHIYGSGWHSPWSFGPCVTSNNITGGRLLNRDIVSSFQLATLYQPHTLDK